MSVVDQYGEAMATEFVLGGKDIWYFAKHVQTQDEELGRRRPYPVDYEYLHTLEDTIRANQKTVVLKSRRLMVSNHCMMRMMRNAFYAGSNLPSTFEIYRGACSSTDELQGRYQMGRAYDMYYSLPEWFRDQNPLVNDSSMMMEFKNGGKLQGFASKREGAQGYGFTEYLFDEMAWQDSARSAWNGLVPTLGQLGKAIAVSTPNGKGNVFYDLWSNKKNKWPNMGRLKLHWSMHPEHDRQWYETVTEGMDERDIMRHFELSFAYYDGDRIWPKFDYATHCPFKGDPFKLIPLPNRPIAIGWDFGFHYPAAVFMQLNQNDQWVVLREYVDFDMDFDDFVKDVMTFRNTFYDPRRHPELHFVDPAGFQRYHQKAESGAKCDVDVIRNRFGKAAQIRPGSVDLGNRDNEGRRLKEVRRLFNLRKDGRPGIIFDDSCETLIEGCNGGYVFLEGQDLPQKNEFSHTQDALQMVITGYNALHLGTKEPTHTTPPPKKRIGHRMGV